MDIDTAMTIKDKAYLNRRPRRNRRLAALRDLLQETILTPADFVAPVFVCEGEGIRDSIQSMPGIERLSVDQLVREARELFGVGVKAVDLFTVTPSERKDCIGSEALRQGNLMQRSVQALKAAIPEMVVMVDIALDPFTDHGHDGIVNEQGEVVNDPTLEVLALMALKAAEAGADVVAPSDMMDGRVAHIRSKLDESGYQSVGICAYTAKYASSFYGPFRDALSSSPSFGDKKSYQMNPGNIREAFLEAALDEKEGADMLLVKPGLPYLDVIAKLKEQTHLPVGAYHVSGEYAMVKAADEKGWIDGQKVMTESLIAMKRAGADFIITYAAKEVASQIRNTTH